MNKNGQQVDIEAFQQRVQDIDHKPSMVVDEKGRVLRWQLKETEENEDETKRCC